MKINSMTTISESITLKILRAANQICQLKSNSGGMYKQTAVVSVRQHEGLMGLSLLLITAVMGANNRVKGATLLPPLRFDQDLLVLGHMGVCRT